MRDFIIEKRMNFPFTLTFLGDSKTAGNDFQPTLLRNLAAVSDYYPLRVAPAQLATGGWRIADLDNALPAWLAAATDAPDLIPLNIGANDISVATSRASFEASMASILDQIHAKWSLTKVGVMLIWRRGADSQCNAMNDVWVPSVLNSRSAWAAVGPDERVFLKSSNDGQAYTSDGVHPNISGYGYTANAWIDWILFG